MPSALTAAQILAEVIANFDAGQRRRFLPGLLVAFIDFFLDLDTPSLKAKNLKGVFKTYPRQTETAAGQKANTLIVKRRGKNVSIRTFYNAVERFIRVENKRFDYPSMAPHATQAWADYPKWLDALATFDKATLIKLREDTLAFVLGKLPSHDAGEQEKAEPLSFLRLMHDFDLSAQKGEPTGAAYQGVVFAYIRADAPHLQVEVDKVRVGAKRVQRVGDIDAWDGRRLIISAEVKHFRVDDAEGFGPFAAEVKRRGAMGMIVAQSFAKGVPQGLDGLGLRPLDLEDLRRLVSVWDPLKQRIAVNAFVYYVAHREQNSALLARTRAFLATLGMNGNNAALAKPA
jgi:hypothetical protein